MRRRAIVPVLLACLLLACGGAPAAARQTPASASEEVPEEITDESYAIALRTYHRLPLDEPARAELGDRLVGYLQRASRAAIDDHDYDRIVEYFARMTSLFSPDDFSAGRLPIELESLAVQIRRLGSQQSDEARVLSALLVLHALDTNDAGYDAQYAELAAWSRSARATLPQPVERYSGLIEVWEEHARLAPAREVLDFLARLYVDRRNLLAQALTETARRFSDPEWRMAMANAPGLLRRAPLDVAAVYLRHGDIASAISRVEQMGMLSHEDDELLGLLREMGGDRSTDAMLEVASAYRAGRPDVARGICRVGYRRHPAEARFAVCLARVAALEGEALEAMAWFSAAIQLQPSARELYDEAFEYIDVLFEENRIGEDATLGRALMAEAEKIVNARADRWPSQSANGVRARLDAMVGRMQMDLGNLTEARARLERSVARQPTLDALLALGLIEERTGDPARAAALYRQALDRVGSAAPEAAQDRAKILEQIGDAQRRAHNAEQALRMYGEALRLWETSEGAGAATPDASALVRKGVLLDRLDRREASAAAFRAAIAVAPPRREVFTQILSHLVVAPPNVALAVEVFRHALRETAIAPEWKVYFSLWVSSVAWRAGRAIDDEAAATMTAQTREHAWWARLAAFGSGTLAYEGLNAEAATLGQHAEAAFYGAMKSLGGGDRTRAVELLRQVLDSQMINYFEFGMACELLDELAR